MNTARRFTPPPVCTGTGSPSRYGGRPAFPAARGYGGRCEVLDSMGDRFQLTVYDPSYRPPRWFGEGITYNIFPDRFCRDRDPVQPEGEGIAPRVLHENWDDLPVYRPDEHGEILNNDFFGGTLRRAVQARLF